MNSNWEIGEMRDREADTLHDMVVRVSEAMVCRDFEAGGRKEFFDAVSMIVYDRPENHLLLVARAGGRPVGLIDVRSRFHICLFFVDLDFQGQGVGRALMDAVFLRCGDPGNPPLEVNSSLYAVPIYESFGFEKRSGICLTNGIRFVEMARPAASVAG